MSDNRMFLFHEPSKIGIHIAQYFSCDWFTKKPIEVEALNNFFSVAKEYSLKIGEGYDDFTILQESELEDKGLHYGSQRNDGLVNFVEVKTEIVGNACHRDGFWQITYRLNREKR